VKNYLTYFVIKGEIMSSLMKAPDNTPVWVDTDRCKACDKCVESCPAGVLSMQPEASSVLGAMISVIAPESCIGCNECELVCPDFAIYVADRKEFKFAKLTDTSKARREAIVANKYRLPAEYKEAN
jgi:2-oxoglutarate ferredoxin oxidoreductase subunit delta